MTHRPSRLLAGFCSAGALFLLPAVAARADENLGVPIPGSSSSISAFGGLEVDDVGAILTAMYVDASGTAHIAYANLAAGPPDTNTSGGIVDLCTIPAGGTTCGSPQVLQTDGYGISNVEISSLKYLPDGNGSAVLAVGLKGLENSPSPPFDTWETEPWSETEVFQPGSSTGTAIGTVYDAGGDAGGDEIYVPDENGIQIVGQYSDYDWPEPGTGQAANAYEFESFTDPSSFASVRPQFLGVEDASIGGDLDAAQVLPGEWPAGITELANGDIGVLAYGLDETAPASTNPVTESGTPEPVGMYVQPAGGGSFGHLQQLGISGPIETDFTPSGYTYLINGVSSDPTGGIGQVNSDPAEDLELYNFDGTSLHWLGTIGATGTNLGGNILGLQSEWDTMSPSYEDPSGDLYTAWYASGGMDACPQGSTANGSNDVSDCLMYRVVGPGGVFGPKIVLSESYEDDYLDTIGDIDQIAANASGAGWVLVWRQVDGSDGITLYAEPLSAAATVPTSPTVNGTVTAVPLTCTGSGSCSLTVTLDSPAFARLPADAGRTANAHVRADARRKVRDVVLARAKLVVHGGAHRRLRLELSAAGKALLSRDHGRLTATLHVIERLGLTKAPSVVYEGHVSLR